jgi:peptidoglycan/LPS O-acetylase OafA/YrhL
MLLDGWDRWGLLIGLLILALVTLVVIVHLTDEMSPDVPWDRLTLALGATILVLTLVKNLRDAESTWASYVFVLMAALLAVGAYRSWAEAQPDRPSVLGRSRRGFSRAA